MPGPNGPVASSTQSGSGPSGSNEPSSTSFGDTVFTQLEFTDSVASLQTATGGLLNTRSISSGPTTKPTPGSELHNVMLSANAANTLSPATLRSRALASAKHSAGPGFPAPRNDATMAAA